MDDPLLVGVLHSVADLPEEDESLRRAETVSIAVGGQRLPRNMLHDEIGPSRLVGARVVDPCYARVIHEGQGLSLRLETRQHVFAVHALSDHLQGHTASHRLGLLGQVYDAHPSTSDGSEDSIRADLSRRRSRGIEICGERRGLPDVSHLAAGLVETLQ